MMTIIDEDAGEVVIRDGDAERRYPLASPDGFAAASRAWLRAGWDAKYVYSFTWLGRPVLQLPEDLIRVQEVIYAIKPDVLIEIGVAHGGGLVFYASLFRAMGRGRVIGIDLDIRPHNRRALEAHELYPAMTLIEADSIDPETVRMVRGLVGRDEAVMIILDSNHAYDHVSTELELYSPLVSLGSYIIACDGIMEQVMGAPRTKPDWATNNPRRAARDFTVRNRHFVIEEPPWSFNEGMVDHRVTYWPDAYLKRVSS
jgi:cephalosporin hydroxylase